MPKDKRKPSKFPIMEKTKLELRPACSLFEEKLSADAVAVGKPPKASERRIGYTISYDRPIKRIIQEIALPSVVKLKEFCEESEIEPSNFYIVLHTLGHGINFFSRDLGAYGWEKSLNTAWADRISLKRNLKNSVFNRANVKPLRLNIIDSMSECLKPECFADKSHLSFCNEESEEPAYNESYMRYLQKVSESIDSNLKISSTLGLIVTRYQKSYRLQHNGAADLTDESIEMLAKRYLVSEIAFHIMIFEKYKINVLAYAGAINELVDIEQTLLSDFELQVMGILIAYREIMPTKKVVAQATKRPRKPLKDSVVACDSWYAIDEGSNKILAIKGTILQIAKVDLEKASSLSKLVYNIFEELREQLKAFAESRDENALKCYLKKFSKRDFITCEAKTAKKITKILPLMLQLEKNMNDFVAFVKEIYNSPDSFSGFCEVADKFLGDIQSLLKRYQDLAKSEDATATATADCRLSCLSAPMFSSATSKVADEGLSFDKGNPP